MTDVLVVGAGGCGLMAALVASEAGAEVLVLEKTDSAGGGTALSHRGLRAAGTRYQREAGVEDSPARYTTEIMGRNSSTADRTVVEALTGVSARMVEYLADVTGVRFELDEFTFGQTVSRSHVWHDKPITDYMLDAIESRPSVTVRYSTPVESLLLWGDEVAGVRADGVELTAGSVVLASGGFGASEAMVCTYIPHAAGVAHPGHEANVGEGIQMALEAGAALDHMDSFQPYPAHVGPGKRGVPPGVITSGGIVVDRRGRRFVDETRYPGGLARAMLDIGGRAFEIFDLEVYLEHRDETGDRSLRDMERTGDLLRGESVGELAASLGIETRALSQTLDRYTQAAGGTDEFGRTVGRVLDPPFYGIAIQVAMYHTQGGVRVDRHARVLRKDGSVIPNLYAGGGVAVGVSGGGMDGYLPGNGLLASLGLGFIAGEAARPMIP